MRIFTALVPEHRLLVSGFGCGWLDVCHRNFRCGMSDATLCSQIAQILDLAARPLVRVTLLCVHLAGDLAGNLILVDIVRES